MPETIFVLARTTGGSLIESYCDYNRMIELWGYRTCELSEIDYQSQNVYVWSTHIGNPTQVFMHQAAKDRKCKLVFWNLEWPNWVDGKLVGYEGSDYLGIEAHVDEVWFSDGYMVHLMRAFRPESASKFRYVFMGGHPDFGVKESYPRFMPEYDFAHFSYLTGVRGMKYHILRDQMGFTMAPNAFGAERDRLLRCSRWGLHLHQFSLPVISPQRFVVFASYRLPIVTDYCAEPAPYHVFQDALVHFDPRKSSVMNHYLRENAVEANYKLVTKDRTFRNEVDKAVWEAGFTYATR